jgi:hypothetical protein
MVFAEVVVQFRVPVQVHKVDVPNNSQAKYQSSEQAKVACVSFNHTFTEYTGAEISGQIVSFTISLESEPVYPSFSRQTYTVLFHSESNDEEISNIFLVFST